jgi:valyl-tRNA synthetase
MNELPKAYDPKEVEPRWYEVWEKAGYFRADPTRGGEPYSIVLPPPNVTGSLHIGHALTATIEDILIRWRRMQGKNVLWLPGTDHAGIATQTVVERELQREGKTRHDLGREAFLSRVWAWKEQHGSRITVQHKALGASLDWSRERFTLDEGSSRAVREVFVRLYEEGLCYRAHRLINLCPRCHTALSDLEVEHEENARGEMFSFAYPLADGSGEIVVATTRPETMLGDTAVAVHPGDERYRGLVGKMLRHPILERQIPIVADDILVDPSFGTGAVKVTPAHDFNDFECGLRHGLPMVNILTIDGKVNSSGGPFAGMDRFDARRAVKEELARQGLARGEKAHALALGRCQRCDAIVEPYLSKQWFVRAAVLAKPAIEAVERGETRFVPESWTKTYFHWMNNIKDWCVSRQLWWGHQIPAWYCGRCDAVTVSRQDPDACQGCGSREIRRDEDVLDTWFSSALWPFSTLGWPEDTADLRFFYPNAVMETGYDILFFWVARMMMMGIHFLGRPPFRTVFLHAMVRDEKGEKMSKTRGNVIDPLDVTEKYGADALRFTLGILAAQGRDIKLSLERVEGYRHFLNKLWNASRFVLMNLGGFEPREREDWRGLGLAERWILSRLRAVTETVNTALEEYRFSEAASALYGFVWHELCDWYIELAKPALQSDDAGTRRAVQLTLVHCLEVSLRLLHPYIPFLTEEIWQKLPRAGGPPSIVVAAFPEGPSLPVGADADAERDLGFLMEVITALRTIRVETGIPPGKEVAATILTHDDASLALLERHRDWVVRLARTNPLSLARDGERPRGSAAAVVRGAEVLVPLLGVIDLDAEHRRLEKEIGKLQKEREGCERRLVNPSFVERAPAEVVARERDRVAEISEKLQKLEANLRRLREIAG